MDYEDEIIFEENFPSENMNIDVRNLCLALIGNSKELTASPRVVDPSEPFDIVTMHLNKKNNIVFFNGLISSKVENKFIDGKIYVVNGKYYIKTNVYRLYEYLEDDDRDYNLEEEFELLDDSLIRRTVYSDGNFFNETLEPLTDIDIDNFIEEKVRKLKLK